jgi:hypothetical protein
MVDFISIAAEFKQFIMKGNVLDLAVAVVIGTAFNAVITAFVSDIITPLIGIAGNVDFAISRSIAIKAELTTIFVALDFSFIEHSVSRIPSSCFPPTMSASNTFLVFDTIFFSPGGLFVLLFLVFQICFFGVWL